MWRSRWRARALCATTVAAGVPVEVSDNVASALWAKLILNCAYNSLSAITHLGLFSAPVR
jgi:2-dehydropantoate 2-reductase